MAAAKHYPTVARAIAGFAELSRADQIAYLQNVGREKSHPDRARLRAAGITDAVMDYWRFGQSTPVIFEYVQGGSGLTKLIGRGAFLLSSAAVAAVALPAVLPAAAGAAKSAWGAVKSVAAKLPDVIPGQPNPGQPAAPSPLPGPDLALSAPPPGGISSTLVLGVAGALALVLVVAIARR